MGPGAVLGWGMGVRRLDRGKQSSKAPKTAKKAITTSATPRLMGKREKMEKTETKIRREKTRGKRGICKNRTRLRFRFKT